MSNIERAAKAIFLEAGPLSTHDAEDVAQALADAGLLVPELPEPDKMTGGWADWGDEGVMPEASVSEFGDLFVYDDGRMIQESPAEIRKVGMIYLAAAAWAEQQ